MNKCPKCYFEPSRFMLYSSLYSGKHELQFNQLCEIPFDVEIPPYMGVNAILQIKKTHKQQDTG